MTAGEPLRVAVVVARWNDLVTRALLAGAEAVLAEAGAEVEVAWVPGSLELPQAARWLAEGGRWDAVVALGCVIRGETPHFEHVAAGAIEGLCRVAADTGVPLAIGVLTTDTAAQALDRAGLKGGNKGAEAAAAALEMARLKRRIRTGT